MTEPIDIARPCPECGAPIGAACARGCASHATGVQLPPELFERFAESLGSPLLQVVGYNLGGRQHAL